MKKLNIRHYMLEFLVFMAVLSEYCYITTKDKYQKLYVSLICTFTSLTVTDTIE